MAKAFSVSVLILAAAMLIAGCEPQPGKLAMIIDRNDTRVPPLATVDDRGLYALFAGEGITPLEAAYLNKGDQFGFQFRDSRIVGVYIRAGQTKVVSLDGILSTNYVWKYQGDKQP